MVSEFAVVLNLDDIVNVFWVVFTQMEQDLQFNLRLMLKFLLVSNDLDCNNLTRFVIDAAQSLTEGTFAEEIYNFKSVAQMVAHHHAVVALVIIVSIVILLAWLALNFTDPCADVVKRLEIQNFSFFKISQVTRTSVLLKALADSHGESCRGCLNLAS